MEKNETSSEDRVVLTEPTDSAQAIVAALDLAARAGFSETARCMIATAVSELATNILRYAKEGVIRLRIVREDGRTGIEVLAEDVHGRQSEWSVSHVVSIESLCKR